MHIKEITDQHRRDFNCIYSCEHCDYEEKGRGYDDANFHQNVIPAKICKQCGLSADKNYIPMETKYAEGQQV